MAKKSYGIKLLLIILIIGISSWFVYKHFMQQNRLPENIISGNIRLEIGRTDISSLYGGRIIEFKVDEGDEVKQGDILAILDDAQISAQLDAASAAKKRAQATVLSSQQQMDVAALDLKNARQMRNENLVSSAELAKRQAQFHGQQAGINAAQAAVEEADANIRRIENMHDENTLTSPLDGTVEYRLAEIGEVVGAGMSVISILNPADFSASLFVPMSSLGKIKTGQDARLRIDGIDAVFPAQISFISRQAQFTPKYVETADERNKLMFRVKLTVAPETALRYQGLLKGGMTGTA